MLVAGPDFGTGSSREHAVWALQNYGFQAVISPRFGDIFRGNSGKAGLVAAQVDEKVVQRLWDLLESRPGTTVTVDLESRTIRAGEGVDAVEDSFDIDDYTRWRLLEGLDDIGITLSHEDDITTYDRRVRAGSRPPSRPASRRAAENRENPCAARGLALSSAWRRTTQDHRKPLPCWPFGRGPRATAPKKTCEKCGVVIVTDATNT